MEEGMLGENRASGYGGVSVWGKKLVGFGTMENGKILKAYRCKNCGYIENYAK